MDYEENETSTRGYWDSRKRELEEDLRAAKKYEESAEGKAHRLEVEAGANRMMHREHGVAIDQDLQERARKA